MTIGISNQVKNSRVVKAIPAPKPIEYIVMIDPGHGDHNDENSMVDPGSTYPTGAMRDTIDKMVAKKQFACMEKDIALSIGKGIKNALCKAGISVFLTRSSDIGDGSLSKIKWRVDEAVNKSCTLFVSIHNDSTTNGSTRGFSVLYRSTAGSELGQAIIGTQSVISIRGNGLHSRSDLGVLNGFERRVASGVAVLIEVGFISNKDEAATMVEKSETIGEQIAKGIQNYIDKQKEKQAATKPTGHPPLAKAVMK